MISCCLIIKNESRWLGEFLSHLKPYVSEFIILDTGSTDDSVAIVERFGLSVIPYAWEGDFSKARNRSLDLATQPWILQLDPDERLSQKGLEELRRCASGEPKAYSFLTRNYSTEFGVTNYCACAGEYPEFEVAAPGFFVSERIRLFPNHLGIHFVGLVHELVESTVAIPIEKFAEPLHHFGSLSSEIEKKKKRNLYVEATRLKAKQNPGDWRSLYELGNELCHSSKWVEAIGPLEEAFRLSHGTAVEVGVSLSAACLWNHDTKRALEVVCKALETHPRSHDLLLNLGVIHQHRRELGEALQVFRNMIEFHPSSFKAYRHAALVLKDLGIMDGAHKLLQQSLAVFPAYPEALRDLEAISSRPL